MPMAAMVQDGVPRVPVVVTAVVRADARRAALSVRMVAVSVRMVAVSVRMVAVSVRMVAVSVRMVAVSVRMVAVSVRMVAVHARRAALHARQMVAYARMELAGQMVSRAKPDNRAFRKPRLDRSPDKRLMADNLLVRRAKVD
jgi:hypothetical protein